MSAAYPPFRGPRVSLARAHRAGRGRVAGRLRRASAGFELHDDSGSLLLASTAGAAGEDGDWVSGLVTRSPDGALRLEEAVVHARRRARTPDPDLPGRLPALRRRAAILDAARSFFRDRGFLEVDTPARVVCPGLEPHLVAFPAGGERYLITSPELHLKRLLAAGAEKLVEFARAFRDDESGPWHRSEFLLLEWYRAFAGLDSLESDCEELVRACAAAASRDATATLESCDLGGPFARTTVREALREHTGLDIAALGDREDLARAVRERGHPVTPDEPWDDLFFRVWIAEVEPKLGRERPVFVHAYPASQAALARTRREPWGDVAERFELYVAGVEVANAFHELNDPAEQRRRHEADRAARRAAGRPVYPLDEAFLAALDSGMPPSSGIALGFDRLVALLVGAGSIGEIRPFD